MVVSAGYESINGLYVFVKGTRQSPSVWYANAANCTIDYSDGASCRDVQSTHQRGVCSQISGWVFACRGHVRYGSGGCRTLANCTFSDVTARMPKDRRGLPPSLESRPDLHGRPPSVGRNCTVPDLGEVPRPTSTRTRTRAASPPHHRLIWTWWAQGWSAAPPVVVACVASWERVNPQWEVRRLSLANMSRYLPGSGLSQVYAHLPHEHSPHYSDLLRLELLLAHGGLWVDATLYAVTSIEAWLPTARVPLPAGHKASHHPRLHGFFGVRYADAARASNARGRGLEPHQVSNYLLYARTPEQRVLRALRANLQLYWARPRQISPTNLWDPDYFVWQVWIASDGSRLCMVASDFI